MRRERRQRAHWWLVLLLAILALLNGFEALEIQRQNPPG
jgi:hypothetical protein